MYGPRSFFQLARLLPVLLIASVTACQASAPASHGDPGGAREQLLIGYELLADTLSEESKLRMLNLFRKLTFRSPVEEVGELMNRIASASKKRSKELEKLRKLSPDVSSAPASDSPIGDAITAMATEMGKGEMLDGDEFNLRFVILQSQATRMVAAIADAIAEFETNARRKKWLLALSKEYEGYRDDLLDVVILYIEGKGAAQ